MIMLFALIAWFALSLLVLLALLFTAARPTPEVSTADFHPAACRANNAAKSATHRRLSAPRLA
jgi:hypothetical protein